MSRHISKGYGKQSVDEQLLANDGALRLGVTLGLFVLLALLETLFPRKQRVTRRRERWSGNWAVQIISALVMRFALPWAIPAAVAVAAAETNAGLLNRLPVPLWAALAVSVLLLDLAIYWQHRLTHTIPLLWRLHRLHHADVDVDVTTALRFHPLEIILSAIIKSGLVWLFGVPVDAIILFAVLLNGMAMFNHANLNLPVALDGMLRKLVVTPDMHRVHHSVIGREHNSNFGFNLSCWDRLFGSYRERPERGHETMVLGLNETNGQKTGSVIWMLKQPFA